MEEISSRLSKLDLIQEVPVTTILLVGGGNALSRVLLRACHMPCLVGVLQIVEINTVAKEQDLERVFSSVQDATRVGITLIMDLHKIKESNATMQIAQALRRDYGLRTPLIFWTPGAPSSNTLSDPNVPGSYHLPFPARLCDLAKAIRHAKPVPNEATLRDIIHRHCRFDERRKGLLHDLFNAVGARQASEARDLARQLAALVEGTNDQEAQTAIAQVEALIAAAVADVPPSPTDLCSPSVDWRSILIVDDDGYSPATIAALKAKGYSPRAVIETFNEAIEELVVDPPDVLLCDYRLEGDPAQGVELAQKALVCEDIKLVILISAEPILQQDVPQGVLALSGLEKFDAERIHTLIIQAAFKNEYPR